MKPIIVYVTYPNQRTARATAEYLLKKRMVACAVFTQSKSMYVWKGKLKEEKEIIALFKTKASLWKAVREDVDKLHPYDVPCIMRLEADALPEYEDWMSEQLTFKQRD